MTHESHGTDEGYAKVWQLTNVAKDVAEVKDLMKTVNDKLDDKYVSKEQLNAALEVMRIQHENDMQKTTDRYEPMRKNLSRLSWVLVSLVVAVIGQLLVNIFGRTQ